MDQIISEKLNINPGGVPPRIKVSQYDDNSRHIKLYLYNGAAAITNSTGELSGISKIYVRGTKPDMHGFSYEATPDTTAAVFVMVAVVLQMTAVAGDVPCELVFVDTNDHILGTANFVLEVEPAALADDTIISDTEIPAIIDAARASAAAAAASATKSESYAVGGTSTRTGEDTDNAKYYKEHAATSATNAANSQSSASQSATAAAGSATAASNSASAAASSNTAAAGHEANALAYKNEAKEYRDQAAGYAGDASYSFLVDDEGYICFNRKEDT